MLYIQHHSTIHCATANSVKAVYILLTISRYIQEPQLIPTLAVYKLLTHLLTLTHNYYYYYNYNHLTASFPGQPG